MQAAERFFEGAFDNVKDEDVDVEMLAPKEKKVIAVKSDVSVCVCVRLGPGEFG
mgnify:CR=1 FL=1